MLGLGGSASAAEEFMTSGILMYATVAAACSSPQTTEINADTRSVTLMKWVHLGLGQGLVFLGVSLVIADHPGAVLAGGALAAAMLYASYVHARKAGLASDEPGTEDT